jgi:regulator of sigma E protease
LEILNSLSWTIASFALVLGIMIFVHELGHYLMAKYLGIRVEVFSLGFGPRLIGFRKGDTDYRISALPLGGYVRMKGENYEEELSGDPDEFLSRPKLHRFAVAIAGPAMNVFLAIALLATNYMIGVEVPVYLSEPTIVGHVTSDSPAEEAGFQVRDQILSVNGQDTPNWESFYLIVATSPNERLAIALKREEETLRKVVKVREEDGDLSGIGWIGVSPPVTNVITELVEGPAKDAGVEVGDEIVQVEAGEVVVRDLPEILDLIASMENQPVEFVFRRGDELLAKTVFPVMMEDQVRIGVAILPAFPGETRTEQYGPFDALSQATQRCYQLTVLTFRLVGKLLTGTTSIKSMSGPIEIAKFSGRAAAEGMTALLGFMSLISLQLGIFNLFPIPILDGGVIALLAIEGLIGRDLSLKAKERIFQVGFLFLVLLMSIVIFNDISKNI